VHATGLVFSFWQQYHATTDPPHDSRPLAMPAKGYNAIEGSS
jgi:hypothetical protein